MRIIHSLEGKSWSGGQQQAFFLALEQKKMGHNVLLICQSGSVLEKKAIEAGINVSPNNYYKEINPFSILNLMKIYDSFKPDVVNVHRAWAHTQWVVVSLLKRFHGLIVTRRVLFRPDFNPVSLVKYRTPAVCGYISVSEAVKGRLNSIGVDSKRIAVVHSATDTKRFSPEASHELSGDWPIKNKNSCPVLLVGNYHKNKGHDLLVEAFDRAARNDAEIELVIAGNETDSEALKNIVKKTSCQERIHLLGFRPDIPSLMQRSQFTVSASYQEGLSGTVRESLSLGIPVLASDIPANLEINKLVPLTLFKSGNSENLATGILRMKNHKLSDLEKRELRSKTVKAFSVKSMVEKTIEAYELFWGNKHQ